MMLQHSSASATLPFLIAFTVQYFAIKLRGGVCDLALDNPYDDSATFTMGVHIRGDTLLKK